MIREITPEEISRHDVLKKTTHNSSLKNKSSRMQTTLSHRKGPKIIIIPSLLSETEKVNGSAGIIYFLELSPALCSSGRGRKAATRCPEPSVVDSNTWRASLCWGELLGRWRQIQVSQPTFIFQDDVLRGGAGPSGISAWTIRWESDVVQNVLWGYSAPTHPRL